MARYSNSVPQILDSNGDPIVGAKKYFFEPGSSTLKTIYSDSALTLATTNPVVSDSSGRFPDIFLDGTYKEVQEDENGVTLWTRDPVGDTITGQLEAWDSGTTYSIDEIVLGSDGEYYRSLANSNIGNDPTSSPASWEQLYFGRIWNANVTYSQGDTVYGSDGYIYISQINSNTNNNPTSDHSNWWPGSPEQLAITASGTDTYTATYGETEYTSGWTYRIKFTNANTSATPTLNLDSLGAKTIKKDGGDALVAGNIPAGHDAILRYDGTDLILLNPAHVKVGLIQRVEATPYTTYSSVTAVIPEDNSIPQNTEGTEIITVSITPESATNRLIIGFNAGFIVGSTTNSCAYALFQDSTANAIAAGSSQSATSNAQVKASLVHEMAAGTTSSTTFKLRIGVNSGTFYINGNSTNRIFGGVAAIRLWVEEVAP